MPWHTRLTAPLVLAAAALACSEQSQMQMTEPEAQITGGPACKLSDLKNAAKNFFGMRTPGYTLASQFTTQNVNKPAVLPIFFNLAQEIAVKALPSGLSETQAALGAEVHRQAVACAPVEDPDYQDNMDNVKAALGQNGAYEVRGRPNSDNVDALVFSKNRSANGGSGIKPPSDGFNKWIGSEVIFYGFTRPTSLDGEASAIPGSPAAFEWSTVRRAGVPYGKDALGQDLRGVVGICVSNNSGDPFGFDTKQLRIQHEEVDGVVLPVTLFEVCTSSSNMVNPPLSPVRRALAWLEDRVMPTPLQAATLLLTTSPSGSIKKFSPVEAVNPLETTLSFVPEIIPDTRLNEGIGVKVHAQGAAGTPWEGLNIKLVAFDNNGSYTLSPDVAVTDENGDADFTGSIIDKAGGYKLLAYTQPGDDIDADGFLPDSVTSVNRFLRTPN
jgi:hypothetical protein